MKILYGSGNILVSPKMGGGASTQIIGFINALKNAGHQVDMDISGEQKVYPKIRSSAWLTWIRRNIPASWLAYEILQILNNRKIQNRLMEIDLSTYDLIWQRYELFTTAYAKEAQRQKMPLVLFIDAPLIQERQTYSHLWLKKAAVSALKLNIERSKLVIAVSDQIAEYTRNITDKPDLSIKVIPNGFSDHILDASREKIQEIRNHYFSDFEGTIIGFVGSPMPWHRLEYLTRVTHMLSKVRNDFRILIIGDGQDIPAQKKLAEELNILDFIKFSGSIPFEDIGPYINALDIGVMPDSNPYGSPMKITEYMACGAVPVAPDLAPIATLCTDHIDSLLFPKDDVDALYMCLCYLLDSPAIRETMGKKARQRAIKNYSWAARIKQVEDLLKDFML